MTALIKTYKNIAIRNMLIILVICTLNFASVIMLGELIQLITTKNLENSIPMEQALKTAGVFAVTYFMTQFSEMSSWYYLYLS